MPCGIENSVANTCTYLQEYCRASFDNDGFIPYAKIYYCSSSSIRPFLIVLFFLWLMVLFSAMATAAGDFLSVHLAVIVRALDIDESLAGVTIFAFGNGSSDLFSTLAAMDSNSGSLAISELFGAAAFITTVVLGLVMVARPFSVSPRTFVGDVLWFVVAATLLMVFIADGHLGLSECLGIIGLYIAFVCFAVFRARNDGLDDLMAETDGIQYISEGGESAKATTEFPGERTPMLAHGITTTEVQAAYTGISAQQTVCRSAEAVMVSGSGVNKDMLNKNNVVMELPLDDSSIALTTSGTQSEGTSTRQQLRRWALYLLLGPLTTSWKHQNLGERTLSIFSTPLLVLISLTTPSASTDYLQNPTMNFMTEQCEESSAGARFSDAYDTSRDTTDHPRPSSKWKLIMTLWPACIPLILGPQFIGLVILQQSGLLDLSTFALLPVCLGSVILSAILIPRFLNANREQDSHNQNHANLATSFLGFTASLTWIYLTASSAVSLLTTLGTILHIPNAVLGASIFAVGNSSNDLIANIAVARRGFPVLAASACLGGPMMNMLLGIGGGGLIQLLKHPGEKGPSFGVSPTLFVSGATLITGLLVTLCFSFCNGWKLNKILGLILVGLWTVTTIVIVVMGTVKT